jgi:hypothetical protein
MGWWALGVLSGSNLFWGGGLVLTVGCLLGILGLAFLGLTLIQGFELFWDRRSFSRAVPYFSILAGHLLASDGCPQSALLFEVQFTHLRSCGHCPSAVVSIVSPYSRAIMHFWQLLGSGWGWSFSSW